MSNASRSRPDPIRRWNRRIAATALAGAVVVIVLSVWAVRPLPEALAFDAEGPQPVSTETTPAAPDLFPIEAFDVDLWNPASKAAPQAAASTAVPAGAPFRLQLVGITEEKGELFAALYDPDKDHLFIVRNGESVANHRVTAITRESVQVTDGRVTSELEIAREGR